MRNVCAYLLYMKTNPKTSPLASESAMSPFTLSIEPFDGAVYQHPYHLGTIEMVACEIAEEIFAARRNIRTIALIRDRKIVDVFCGHWTSEGEY